MYNYLERMVGMVMPDGKNQRGIDFSIMPTLECNLQCSFCMYDCSPFERMRIDLVKLERFLNSIPLERINSFGLYGGEPSINIPLYKKVIAMLPLDSDIFIITNGTWTKSLGIDFIEFVMEFNLQCFISSTLEHKAFQDAAVLKNVLRSYSNFTVKEDDTQKKMLPMGRNRTAKWECTKRCGDTEDKKLLRFAVMPNGVVIFQSCDGAYPIVGGIDNPFSLKNYLNQVKCCQAIHRRSKS